MPTAPPAELPKRLTMEQIYDMMEFAIEMNYEDKDLVDQLQFLVLYSRHNLNDFFRNWKLPPKMLSLLAFDKKTNLSRKLYDKAVKSLSEFIKNMEYGSEKQINWILEAFEEKVFSLLWRSDIGFLFLIGDNGEIITFLVGLFSVIDDTTLNMLADILELLVEVDEERGISLAKGLIRALYEKKEEFLSIFKCKGGGKVAEFQKLMSTQEFQNLHPEKFGFEFFGEGKNLCLIVKKKVKKVPKAKVGKSSLLAKQNSVDGDEDEDSNDEDGRSRSTPAEDSNDEDGRSRSTPDGKKTNKKRKEDDAAAADEDGDKDEDKDKDKDELTLVEKKKTHKKKKIEKEDDSDNDDEFKEGKKDKKDSKKSKKSKKDD